MVLRTPFALTCTGSPVLLAGRLLLSAGGRYGCPRVRALSALARWVDGGLAGLVGRRGLATDFQRTRVTWSALPMRSAATTHAPPTPARSRDCYISTLPSSHRTTKHQSKSGAATTGPGDHHNRRPTGGVRLSTKLIRCNDYPTSAAPAEPPREANTQMGFLGAKPLS